MKVKYLVLMSLLLLLIDCKEKSQIKKTITITENYDYYPIKDGRVWTYETEDVDSNGNKTKTIEVARYSQDSMCTNVYRDNILRSMFSWNNIGDKLGCCGDMILLDYSLKDCEIDSVLIYQKTQKTVQTIHQFCKEQVVSDLIPKYNQIKCIKTRQENTFDSGRSLHIIQFFGFGIGLVYRQQALYDELGNREFLTTMRLVDHTF